MIAIVLTLIAATPFEAVEFQSRGVTLKGTLALPEKPVAALVFVHGSGKQPVSEKNIKLLADDAAAGLDALSRHRKLQGIPLGLAGISQAGWIVPIAATKSSRLDFIVLWSAPVCRVSEDIFSKHTADADAKEIPSYAEALAARKSPYRWPAFLGADTDPTTSLKTLNVPNLWLFGAEDGSIPVDLSIERLNALRRSKKPYDYVLFSGQGHNNLLGTMATAVDWIKRTVR